MSKKGRVLWAKCLVIGLAAVALLTWAWIACIENYLATSMIKTTATVVGYQNNYPNGGTPILRYTDMSDMQYEAPDFGGYSIKLGQARGHFLLPLGSLPSVGEQINLYYEKSDPAVITTFRSPLMKAVYVLPITVLFIVALVVSIFWLFVWLYSQWRFVWSKK